MQTTPGFLETLALHPWLFVACCVVLGLLIGSFLNVVIHRLPIMMENELRRDYADLVESENPAPAAAAEAVVSDAATAAKAAPTADAATAPDAAPVPEADTAPEAAMAFEASASAVADTPGIVAAADAPAIPAEGPVTPESVVATAEAPATPVEPAYNLVVPRSACPHCKRTIRAQENIPVISWLMLGGKCSACGARISKRYPLVELATGVLSGFVAWHFGFGFTALAALLFTWFLIALAMIDFDTKFLPDQLTYPLLWCGLLLSLFNPVWAPGADPMTPRASIMGAAAGYLSLWAFYWLYKLVRKEEGMGYGDFKLFAAIGAWLGLQMLLPTLIFASGVGALVGGTAMLLKGKGMKWEIPFGPFLAAAGWLAMLYGHRLVDMYLLHFSVPG